MAMDCSRPVPRSLAETWTMPLASISKVTSICGTPRGAGAMPVSWEAAEGLVVGSHLALALQHVDLDGGLAVRGGEKICVCLTGMVVLRSMSLVNTPPIVSMPRDSGGHVQQHDVFHVAAEHAGLNGRADGHALIRVDALVGLLAGDALHGFLHGGDTGGTAHEDDLVDVLGGDAGVLHGLIERTDGLVDQILRQLVELGAGDGDVQMLGAGVASAVMNGRLTLTLIRAGQFDLGLFGASLRRCRAMRSLRRSMPFSFWNSEAM